VEPDVDYITFLQDVERRADVRPCTLHGLDCLEGELEDHIREFRRNREARREKSIIEPEAPELRSAIQYARNAIRRAKTEHEAARMELSQLAELVRRGHVHEAAILQANVFLYSQFADLSLDFVRAAVAKQRSREQRLVAAILVATGIILAIVTLVELLKRSSAQTP
jgi:hypothetical protein